MNDETLFAGRKQPIFALRAILTAVYFPPEQDFLQLRSISACAHQQYCNRNWISGHSIIITGRKSVPTTQSEEHLAGVGVEVHIFATHVVVRGIICVIGSLIASRVFSWSRRSGSQIRGITVSSNQPHSHTFLTLWKALFSYVPSTSRDFVCSLSDGGERQLSRRWRHLLRFIIPCVS